MKTLTAVLVVTVLVIHISGYLIHVPTSPIVQPEKTASTQWLHIQKLMIPLFENVCEVSNNPVIRRLAEEYTPMSEEYSEEVVTNFQSLLKTGLLPKGQIFSEYNLEHMNELKTIYEVLYSAKNFDAFYKAAAWARQTLNCGLYVNAIYMSIQKRRDTERLSIPAPYELLPNYFIRKDVIVQASSIIAGNEITPTEAIRDEGNAYHIDANYTAMFYDNEDDSKLAYFREDIGLNSFYYLRKLKMSPWFNDDINSSYGENMYQMMKQFTARYNLERYANGLPEIDGINWNSLPDIPYDPELIYSDGNEFIHRTSPFELTVTEDLALLQTIEKNIVAVVDHMRQSGYNKTQILNHLMEILVTGDRSYETLARQLLGKDRTDNGHTSVLEHYMTTLRDPMFWKINKNIVDLVDSALQTLPTYSRNELYFPGVEVVNIEVKKMMTAYDYFEFDVTDSLKIEESNSMFDIKIGQPRLNHKPFTIKVNISSLVTKKGLIKIYMGPKLMPGELAMKKNLFMLLDQFETNLKIGTNIISRTSDDIKHLSGDFMSLKTINKNIEDAEFGLDSLPLTTIESQTGFPSRFVLPKGSSTGLPLQIFVFVAPFTKANFNDSYPTNSMEFNSAILSPGFPLDLTIEDRELLTLPNALIKYTTVTQKGDSKVENYGGPGVTKKWYGTNSYDPSARPVYSSDKKSFDYKSKKGPYAENENEFLNVASQDDIFNKDNQDDFIDVMNTPQLLKSSKSNLSVTPKSKGILDNEQPIDYKSRKALFSKKEYPTNRNDYFKYRTATPEENKVESTIATPTNNDNVAEVENQDNIEFRTHNLLSSANFDYSSKYKPREPFDYKEKKAQFDKKDYASKREKYYRIETDEPSDDVTVTSTLPESSSELPRVILNEDMNNVDLANEIKNNDINAIGNDDVIDRDDSSTNSVDEPTFSAVKKRTPTVYDFLFPIDYDDFNVYE